MLSARTEKQIQRDIVRTLEQFGCTVIRFSQPFGSLQTKGIADLRVYHRDRKVAAWFEVKRNGARQSPGQVEFQRLVESVGETYILGGIPECLSLLRDWGFRLAAPTPHS